MHMCTHTPNVQVFFFIIATNIHTSPPLNEQCTSRALIAPSQILKNEYAHAPTIHICKYRWKYNYKHMHTHTHTHTHRVQRIKDKETKNLAPVRYTPTTLTLTFKVEMIRLIKAQRVCVCGGGVCVFVATRKNKNPTFMFK